jgi:iron complex outermembrane recepter protein
MRRLLLGTAGIAALLVGSSALAQATPTGTEKDSLGASVIEEVIVVGTRSGGRTDFQSTVPVSSVGKAEIEHSASLPGELGAALASALPTFDFPRYSNDGVADAVRTGQLRGLKPDQTLVLINGKRVHTTSVFAVEGSNGNYTAPFDFNTVATNGIQRVEVLVDGAGAQYGADAVAGVLNIVLDQQQTGGHASLEYGLHHTSFKPTKQTLNDGDTYTANLDYGWRFGEGGFLTVGVEAYFRGSSNRAGYTQDKNGVRGPISFEANPYLSNSSQNTVVALAGRVMAAGDGEAAGGAAFLNAEYGLGNAWTGYSFVTASYRNNKGDAFFRWPADWGGSGPDGNRNPGPVYPNGYRPITQGKIADFNVANGVKGKLLGWDADFSVTTGGNFLNWGVSNSLNPSFGSASPKSFHLYSAENLQTTLNTDFARLFDIGTYEPVSVAFGAEYRNEHFATFPGDEASYTAGPLIEPVGAEAGPGLMPIDAGSATRDVWGIYADFSNKVLANFTVDAAVRYDHYSDFGGKVTAKIAGRFEIVDGVAVRGSASTNYLAPSLAQLVSQTSSQVFSTTTNGLVTTLTAAPGGNIAQLLGFSGLKAETANNYSAGFTIDKGPFSGYFDVFQIDIRNGLAVFPQIQGAGVISYLKAMTGRDFKAINLLQNLDQYSRQGYDVKVDYRSSLYDGVLDVGVGFTSGRFYAGSQKFTTPSVLTSLGYTAPSYATTVYRQNLSKGIFSANWSNDDWRLDVRSTRWGDQYVQIRGTSTYQKFPAKFTFDLEISKKFYDQLTLSIGGNNIFDAYPARQDYANTYSGGLPYNNVQQGFLGAFYYSRLAFKM